MKYRSLGESGIEASVVAFGAWAIGGWMWGGTREQEAIVAIQCGLDCGMNFIDTAPVYGFGRSEEIVGKALKGRREKAVVATKCGLIWESTNGRHHFDSDEDDIRPGGNRHVYRYLGPESIRNEIDRSLKRLDIEYIDLYQTHWQDTTTAVEDTMAALMELKDRGKIRAIGCSNATPEEMKHYMAAGSLSTDQEKYSMLDRDQEETNLPFCTDNGIAYLAYSPLAQGLLTGKVGPDRAFGRGDQRSRSRRFSQENRRRVAALLDEFMPIADGHAVTLAQLTIAWTLAQPGCTHALVGARNSQQARENALAGALELTPEELKIMHQAVEAFQEI